MLREVTGTEAGYSGEDQIRIMLERIHERGGAAMMQELYDAVEQVLNPQGMTLSKQGKSSVRFFINEVAVRKGYVLPYDRQNPGWRLASGGHALLGIGTPENVAVTTPPNTADQARPRPITRRRVAPLSPTNGVPPSITLDMLEQTRQYMPDAEFRRAWGDLYDQLLAAERAKATTHLDDRALLNGAKQQAQRIQDFLQGRSQSRPGSEELCDWILFCYWFSLYREAVALWPIVNPDDIEPRQAERTKKIAAVCKTKLS